MLQNWPEQLMISSRVLHRTPLPRNAQKNCCQADTAARTGRPELGGFKHQARMVERVTRPAAIAAGEIQFHAALIQTLAAS
jgi:hypothetical protein